MIRIGKIRETDRRYCRENDLDWVDEFTSLGIVFRASDIRNITRYNIDSQLNDIKKLLNVWLMRNISPIGRIQKVKSLALSKLTHLFLSLPSPDSETMKTLEKMFNNFVWRNGRHCVNKEILQAPNSKGGLNMIYIPNFDLGLKLTWLRKMIKGHEPWLEIAENLKMDQLLYLGPNEIENIRINCSNPFWKDVCRAAIKLHNELEYTKVEEIRKAPLWGNILINIPINHWLIKGGYREVGDLFDENGELITLNDLQRKLNRQIPFVTYQGLITAIPRTWKTVLNENPRDTLNVNLSKFQSTILQDQKGCRAIRETFQNNVVQTGWVTKWDQITIEEIDLGDWEVFYRNMWKTKTSVNCQYFQYQITTRTLITKKKLKIFNILQEDRCSYCDEVTETIEHLLYNCPSVLGLWEKVISWLEKNNYYKLILLGPNSSDPLLYTIILHVKHSIYKNKFKGKVPSLLQVQHILKNCMEIENYIAMCTSKLQYFLGKWSPIYKCLSDV